MPPTPFIDAVERHFKEAHNVVVHAPTGAGKSTTLPFHLLHDATPERKILLVQPRQVAARAVASRIAHLYGCRVGQDVGYHVRFDRKASEQTRLLVVTTGIALQYIQSDPFLDGWEVLLLDEFHERSVDLDLLVAFARESQRALREDLRIGALSATMDIERAQDFLDARLVQAQGRSFPIEMHYAKRTILAPWSERGWERAWAQFIVDALGRGQGDLLAFLPGVGEILRVSSALENALAAQSIRLVHLYGSMRAHEQDAALETSNQRRVVLSTNVAETSLTVPGIDTVVDFGWVRRARMHPGLVVNRIMLERVSRASADQRAGRAGRLRPGTAFRAWTDADHRRLDAHEVPEILRVDAAVALMHILKWQGSHVEDFAWFEPPTEPNLHAALALMHDLHFMQDGTITELGRAAAALPLHPRLSAVVLATLHGPLEARAQTLAALLADTDFPRGFFLGKLGAESDVDHILDQLHRNVQVPKTQRVSDIVSMISRSCTHTNIGLKTKPVAHLSTALLYGFKDRLAQRRSPKSKRGLLTTGVGVRLAEDSTVVHSPFFIVLDVDARPGDDMLARAAVGLTEAQIPSEWIQTEDIYRFSEEHARVEARRIRTIGAIVLDEKPLPRADKARTARTLTAAAMAHQESLLAKDAQAQQWLMRYALAHRYMPERYDALGDDFWTQVWGMACADAHSFDDLRKRSLVEFFRVVIGWNHAQALDDLLPLRMTVPSGRQHKVEYTENGPVLAVRIQEMFGATRTPRILDGRLPVTLHLLAPNFRPQQITDDLEGFWRNTYPEIRKELRARYAKHAWPENPMEQ